MISIMAINTIAEEVWVGHGFLTNEYRGMPPRQIRSHIHMVNPRQLYFKVIKFAHFYDRLVFDYLIDLKIDVTQDKLICLNEWTKTIIPTLEHLVEFLEKEHTRFSYIEYAWYTKEKQ